MENDESQGRRQGEGLIRWLGEQTDRPGTHKAAAGDRSPERTCLRPQRPRSGRLGVGTDRRPGVRYRGPSHEIPVGQVVSSFMAMG